MKLIPFSRFIVNENSMSPAYKSGDHILSFNWASQKIGDAVIFKQKGKAYLKRIDKIESGKIFISGDNEKESAKFDPISKNEIVGKVILRY